jgi:predicted nucleic acid-binding protein
MYLVDTNIWLERLLGQEKSDQVGEFLSRIPAGQLAMSDFTLHSIGIVLHRLGTHDVYLQFVEDVFAPDGVALVSVQPEGMKRLVALIDQFGLDFDDAYQYVTAERYEAVLVSFDSDFDVTDRGRQTPADVLSADQEIAS